MNSKDYIKLIIKTKLAYFTKVKGFYVLRPYGYKIWENIKNIINKILIKYKYENVYFPLLIPKSVLNIYNNHFKNFYKECAIVTHTKLIKKKNDIIVDPNSKLNEELIIRPTSETIIWDTYSKLIESYKDLPILINQWSNVVRLEFKNKMFIRNSEILWQEGHTGHKNKKEAIKEIKLIKKIYKKLIKNYLSIPFFFGKKTKLEKFSGSKFTYSFETLTKNGKCLQLATIHFLAKNFSKAFNVIFTNKKNKKKYVWCTSWGLSVRLIGAIIMIHSDNKGLILPPKIAPIHIIIIPIINNKNKKYKKNINNIVKKIKKIFYKKKINIKYDNNFNIKPGKKFYKYEKMGIPLRITIGKKEIIKKKIEITRRDNFKKYYIKLKNKNIFKKKILKLLKLIQINIYNKAKIEMKKKIFKINDYFLFKKIINNGGIIITNFKNNKNIELKIKNETKATIRCIIKKEKGICIYSGKKTNKKVIFGKSY